MAKGEPLMEVDKVTMEIESTGAGVLGGVRAKEGDLVPVGQVIGYLLEAGEARAPAGGRRRRARAWIRRSPSRWHGTSVQEVESIARRPGASHGSKGSRCPREGHGPGGRIVEADVIAAASQEAAPEPEGRLKASAACQEDRSRPGSRPGEGSRHGPGGRIVQRDVLAAPEAPAPAADADADAGRGGSPQRHQEDHRGEDGGELPIGSPLST